MTGPLSHKGLGFLASAGMRFMIALGFSIAGRGLLSNTYSSRVPVLNQVTLLHVLGVRLLSGSVFLSRPLPGVGIRLNSYFL